MHFSPEVTLGFLLLLGSYLVGITAFVVRTNSKADDAHDMAEKAQAAVNIQQAALSMFREQVATQYVDRQDLRDMEKRLTDAIDKLGDRLDHKGR